MIFRYAQGAHVATMKVNRNMRLSQDGQSMTVAARATLYDLNGNVLQAFPVVASGVRLPVERIRTSRRRLGSDGRAAGPGPPRACCHGGTRAR